MQIAKENLVPCIIFSRICGYFENMRNMRSHQFSFFTQTSDLYNDKELVNAETEAMLDGQIDGCWK